MLDWTRSIRLSTSTKGRRDTTVTSVRSTIAGAFVRREVEEYEKRLNEITRVPTTPTDERRKQRSRLRTEGTLKVTSNAEPVSPPHGDCPNVSVPIQETPSPITREGASSGGSTISL